MKAELTIADVLNEARKFSKTISQKDHVAIRGVTDGKAIGTYLERQFKEILMNNYAVDAGSSSAGIDLPSELINIDIKTTSVAHPQSSSPFKNAREKIFGLGYNILLFIYEKDDTLESNLEIVNCVYIAQERTGDFQITKKILELLSSNAGKAAMLEFLRGENLPADEAELERIVSEILATPPEQGYLTISNALQWRLHYNKAVLLEKDQIRGVDKIL